MQMSWPKSSVSASRAPTKSLGNPSGFQEVELPQDETPEYVCLWNWATGGHTYAVVVFWDVGEGIEIRHAGRHRALVQHRIHRSGYRIATEDGTLELVPPPWPNKPVWSKQYKPKRVRGNDDEASGSSHPA